jgi:hypothetical protein
VKPNDLKSKQMALAKRLISVDGNHAKKHDDPHVLNVVHTDLLSKVWRGPRRKRLILGIIGILVLYLFIKNIPTDLTPVSQRIDPRFSSSGLDTQKDAPKTEVGPDIEQSQYGTQFYFNGPIKFYNLAPTLQKDKGYGADHNHNVLFAFSSLKSASSLIPLACQMSRQQRNKVHVALMGRDEISIGAVQDINGIVKADCPVQWHDARPDHSTISSDNRMSSSVRAGFSYIYKYLQTSVVIIDTSLEHSFFTHAIRDRTNELDVSLIALSNAGDESLQWLTKLDSQSLRFWNRVQLDIVVHSAAESSASLMRLLRSIKNADYFGNPLPRLTVELPSRVDPPTLTYLSRFRWPPSSLEADSKLVIRHRTDPSPFTPAEASLHTVETFYPVNGLTSHVLILAPNAELSPSYYHYLMYAILEYKYSANIVNVDHLLGISLDLPTKGLNGTATFSPSQAGISTPCFLWQAPNSNAALYFGDKWIEFHSFLSNRLTVEPDLGQSVKQAKLISTQSPAWLEHMLELMRARGYSMLYPSFADQAASSIVSLHQELYHMPEEFAATPATAVDSSQSREDTQSLDSVTILTADVDSNTREKDATAAGTSSILTLLSQGSAVTSDENGPSGLPNLADLPLLSFLGESLTLSESVQLSTSFADEFAIAHGGCRSLNDHNVNQRPAEYLFCLPELIPVETVQDAG